MALSVRDTFAERHMAQYHRRISYRVCLGHFWLCCMHIGSVCCDHERSEIHSPTYLEQLIQLFKRYTINRYYRRRQWSLLACNRQHILAFSGVETEMAPIHPAVDNIIILEDDKPLGFLILLYNNMSLVCFPSGNTTRRH